MVCFDSLPHQIILAACFALLFSVPWVLWQCRLRDADDSEPETMPYEAHGSLKWSYESTGQGIGGTGGTRHLGNRAHQ